MKNNQAQAATAEVVEGRELAKGNAGKQTRGVSDKYAARTTLGGEFPALALSIGEVGA